MRFPTAQFKPARHALVLLGIGLCLSVLCTVAQARKHIYSDLKNFDLPVPGPVFVDGRLVWPNDVHIVIYGTFPNLPGLPDVVDTFQNGAWGKASAIEYRSWSPPEPDMLPTHPGYGYDRITVTYTGPELQEGGIQHFGVALRPCRLHVHVEIWWTYNGKRLWRMCPILHLWKIRVDNWWIFRVNNPTDRPIQLVQARFFRLGATVPRAQYPRLQQLVTEINPAQWQGTWSFFDVFFDLPLDIAPGGALTFRVPNQGDSSIPIVTQFMSRDLDSTEAAVVLTDRNTEEFDSDTNGDGSVGTADLLRFRGDYNLKSVDVP